MDIGYEFNTVEVPSLQNVTVRQALFMVSAIIVATHVTD